MNLDLSYLEEKLLEATYEPELGIRLVHLTPTEIAGKKLELIAVKVDPGKQLIPHLHEIDGEICIPLTEGIARLGEAQKDTSGEYVMETDKIVVDWEKPQTLTPGKSFDILAGKAHYFYATPDKPCLLLFILPETHLGEDRKFVIYPPKED